MLMFRLLLVGLEAAEQQTGMKRIASTSSMAGGMGLSNYASIYNNVWRVLQLLAADPSPLVADMAKKLVSRVRQKVSATVPLQMMLLFLCCVVCRGWLTACG